MAIVTRSGKGSALTIEEMDGNFTYLEGLSGGSAPYSQIIFEVSELVIEYGSSDFIIGELYQIPFVESGDNFTNIGYVDREPFIATGITPSSFTNGTTVLHLSKNVTYTIYKNDLEDFQISKEFDVDDNLYLSITFSNFSTNYNSNLQINYNSNNASRNISYDPSVGKYVIGAFDSVIDLKIFNMSGVTASIVI